MRERDFPYIYVTWISGLLSGDKSCEYAAWFKAHYQDYEKTPSDFDSATWNQNHTALLNDLRGRLEAEGQKVYTEAQNKFTWTGRTAAIGGKADLVSVTPDGQYTVHDAKTGKPRSSDVTQVQIYMWALPRANDKFKGQFFEGNVEYAKRHTVVPAGSITPEWESRLVQIVKRVSASDEARAVPSQFECRFCDIADCQYREGERQEDAATPVQSLPPVVIAPQGFDGMIYDCEIVRAIPPHSGIETEPGINYCGGWRDFENMGISVIGAYDYPTDSYRVFCQDNLDDFMELVDSRRWVVGFNNLKFDNELIGANGIEVPTFKTYDLLQELWRAAGLGPTFNPRTHGGYGLAPTCQVNFGIDKTGDGALAPVLWQRGFVGKVIDYCLNDIKLTKRLLDRVLSGEPIVSPKKGGEMVLRQPIST